MQSHKVRRLDVAEVAKLGRDNEQAASTQTAKQEDIKQEEVKEEDVPMEGVKQEEVKQEGVKLEDVKQEGVSQEAVSQEPGSSKPSKSAAGPTGSCCRTLLRAACAWHHVMKHGRKRCRAPPSTCICLIQIQWYRSAPAIDRCRGIADLSLQAFTSWNGVHNRVMTHCGLSALQSLLARLVVLSFCSHLVLWLQLQPGPALDQEGLQLWGPLVLGPQQALEAAHE